jgi:transposase-like protein
MSVFKRCRFPAEIILPCVRWYCRYAISCRDLAEMIATNAALLPDPAETKAKSQARLS